MLRKSPWVYVSTDTARPLTNSPSWVALPGLKYGSGTFEVETLVDAGRDINGFVVGTTIGKDKCKINVEFPALTTEETRDVFHIFDKDNGGSFYVWVKFYDVRIDGWSIKRMYVGNRKGQPIMFGHNGSPGAKTRWLGVTCNLIEV